MAENNSHLAAQFPKEPHPLLKTHEFLIGKWKISGADVEGEVTF